MTRCFRTVALLLLLGSGGASEATPHGEELLARMIAYHDPAGVWMSSRVALEIESGYADGRTRVRDCVVDFATADYEERTESGGVIVEREIRGGKCRFRVDGREEISEGEREEHKLTFERTKRIRDYVSYLWGLPMKLRDPGARVADEVKRTRFEGRDVLDLLVTYDEEVGTDRWHFYVTPDSARLVGYAFYKDVEETRGERIVLTGEVRVGAARIPETRAWYHAADGEFLGTDVLRSGSILE